MVFHVTWMVTTMYTVCITLHLCCLCVRISTEHSPKLQIRSHSYLRAVSEVSINRSLDTLDPKTLLDPKSLLSSPQYRSRNESYMRAMSTISQVGCQHCCLYLYSMSHLILSPWIQIDLDRCNSIWPVKIKYVGSGLFQTEKILPFLTQWHYSLVWLVHLGDLRDNTQYDKLYCSHGLERTGSQFSNTDLM